MENPTGGRSEATSRVQLFFETLFPNLAGQHIEFRRLGMAGEAESSYFPSIEDALRVAAMAAEHPTDENVYFGVCPRAVRKGGKEAVQTVFALWADLDGKDYPGGKPGALDRLHQFRFRPTAIVDSGNGYHAYWRLKTSFRVQGPESMALIEGYLKALAHSLGADSTSAELARILRVPGTLNLKNFPKVTRVTLLECEPERQWDLSDFAPPDGTPEPAGTTTSNPPGWVASSLVGLRDGNRNDTFTKIAGRLHHGGLAAVEILELLLPHAHGCGFPEAELQTLVAGICRRYPPGNPVRDSPTNTGKPEPDSRPPLVTLSPAELLGRTPESVTWRVEGVLPAQGVGILAAPAGYGKSWALLDLAISVSLGERWLDYFPTLPGRVLYIDEESSQELLGIRLRKLLAFRERSPESLDIHFCVGQSVSLAEAAGVARLRTLLSEIRPRLIIIDSYIRVHRAEENSASDMAGVSAVIKDLVREFDCAIAFADHQRKPGSGETSLDTMLRGSTEKAAFVDCLLSMKKTNVGIIVEHSKSRFAEPAQTFVLRIEDPVPGATQVSHAGSEDALQQEAMVTEARPFIEGYLGQEGDWVPRRELLDKGKEAKVKEKAINVTLKLLLKEGVVEREDRPSKSGRGNKAAHLRLIQGGANREENAPPDARPEGGDEGPRQSGFELPTISSPKSEPDSEGPVA